MRRIATALLAWLLAAMPVLAQGTIPNGFPQDTPQNVDGNASVILATPPAPSTFLNYRIMAVTSPVVKTDGGAGSNFTLSLTTIPINLGGTNGITAQAGFNNLADGVAGAAAAGGDILYRNGANWTRLAKGADGNFLWLASGVPAWTNSPSGAPSASQYLTLALDAGLSAERVLTAGSGIGFTDLGANSTLTVAVDSTVVRTTGGQSVGGIKTFTNDVTLASGVNEVRKGTSFDITITRSDPAAARSFNLPDVASGDFVMTTGAQSISGNKTFGSGNLLASNIVNGANTLTLPAVTDTIVTKTTIDILTNKELTNPLFTAATITLKQTTANYALTWNNPGSAGTRTYYITDRATDSDFAMLAHNEAYTAGGVIYTDGSTLKNTGAGSSGNALISTGAGAPSFATLGAAGGGTGITTVPAKGSILVGNAGGTAYANLPVGGVDGQVLTVAAGATNGVQWAPAGGGSVTVNTATANQMAYYSASTTIDGAADLTRNPAGTFTAGVHGTTTGNLILKTNSTTQAAISIEGADSASIVGVGSVSLSGGSAGGNPQLVLRGHTSGGATLTVPSVASGPVFVLPAAGASTTQELVPFGGNGSDGAITVNTTTSTNKIWYATTFATTASASSTCNNCVINASSTITFASSSLLFDTAGYPGAPAQATASQQGEQGSGPTPGRGGGEGTIALSVVGGGGGASCIANGGNGGNGSATNGGGGTVGASCAAASRLGSGGGGGGSGSGGTGGAGAAGGGVLRMYAAGAIDISAAAAVSVNSATGGNAVTLGGGGGGGGGGSAWLFSAASIALGTTKITVAGGTGGTGTGASSGGGGGGGGGYVFQMSPTNTGTVTATAGNGGSGTGATGTAGTAGSLATYTQTPTLPTIVYCDHGSGVLAQAHLERGRKWLHGESFEHLHFTQHEGVTWLAAFYAKRGHFDDLCYLMNFGGTVEQAIAQTDMDMTDTVAELKADKSLFDAFPPVEIEQTCKGDFFENEGGV